MVRLILTLACAAVLASCASESDSPSDAKLRREPQDLETWTRAADGVSGSEVEVIVRDSEPPCTLVEVHGTTYAALWPTGATRTDEGVVMDGDLYRFGEPTEITGREYTGPRTTTACLAANIWMVLK